MTVEEYRAQYGDKSTRSAKRHKYGARKVTADGITFDSEKERRRWQELCLLQQAGAITNLRRQVKYELIPEQRGPSVTGPRGGVKKGKLLERPVSYVADFVYEKNGETVVEDTKGCRTKEYIIKRKLMLWVHGIRIQEI